MKRVELGNVNGDVITSDVFTFENMNQGFSVQVSGRNLTGTVNVFVMGSNGANDGGTPVTSELDDWTVLDTAAMVDGSSYFTQGDYWGKFIYVLIDGSTPGTLDNVTVYYNQK